MSEKKEMTREEATKYAESKKMMLESLIYNDDCKYGNYAMCSGELSFVNAALTALRPVSREQVEKVWRGCEKCNGAGEYSRYAENMTKILLAKYCPHCGRPLTDEAVEMVMERLEALYETD